MDDFRRDLEFQSIKAKLDRSLSGGDDKPITNTAKMHPAEHLVGAMNHAESTGTTDGFIEGMEAAGQREFVKAAGSRLPTAGTTSPAGYNDNVFDWSQWGIKIGNVVEGDDIWVEAELPEGWKIQATDHSMWSELVDDQGRKRAGIFYKAAFYDRSSHIRPDRRYQAHVESVNDNEYGLEADRMVVIKDGGHEIHRFGPFVSKPEPEGATYAQRKEWCAYDMAEEAAKEYMKEHYPDYEDPAAYWD